MLAKSLSTQVLSADLFVFYAHILMFKQSPTPLVLTLVPTPTSQTDYTVFKGKGAMAVKVVKPTWERVPSSNALKIARRGTVLLEFANSTGEREYDWTNKEAFALNVVECADIMVAVESGQEKQFYHDPNKMSSGEGTVSKTLRISPGRDSGYFFSLSVSNKAAGTQKKYDANVTPGELRVISRIMDVRYFLTFFFGRRFVVCTH